MALPSERRSENDVGGRVTSPRPPVNWRGICLDFEMPAGCRRLCCALRLAHVGGTTLRGDCAVDCPGFFALGLLGARSLRAAAAEGRVSAATAGARGRRTLPHAGLRWH